MPRRLLALATVLLALVLAAPAGAAPLRSDNVTLLTKLPDSVGAIGARFSGDGKTMYVTSATGLQIYDVSQPASPRKLSQLPLPHFENEDVDVGRDTVVITNDPSFSNVGMIYLIDVSDPANPAIRSTLPTNIPGVTGAETTGNGHIANCIAACDYLYTTGTSEGLAVYDIRDLDAPRFVKTIELPGQGFTHDVHIDSAGIAWVTGEDGTFGYDVSDPVNPVLEYRSDPSIVNTGGGLPGDDGSGPLDFLHHNSLRTSIDVTADGTVQPAAQPGQGNVLAVTEEDYAKPTCEGQGSVQTWRITDQRNPDGTIKLELLDMWTTELNELANLQGRSPATGNCSAHWFDEDKGLLAQGWYDQGVRFLDISNPRDIRQVGFYASTGTFWAAYFAPTDPAREIVYGLDTTSGIDVLHIERGGAMATKRRPASLTDLAAGRSWGVKSPRWGFACPLPGPLV
jgi:hypothetical protein